MAETFEPFRERVLADPDLQARLRGLRSHAAFVARAVELAEGLGLELRPEDVEEALRRARREWLERWI